MALGRECLQSMVTAVGDDDSAVVVDAQSLRIVELAWSIALRAELEQERSIDQRQHLHSMIVIIRDDDSMSIIVDRNACWTLEHARLVPLLAADLEQEREIDRRQDHQSAVLDIGDDDAMMMLVDRNVSRMVELEIS